MCPVSRSPLSLDCSSMLLDGGSAIRSLVLLRKALRESDRFAEYALISSKIFHSNDSITFFFFFSLPLLLRFITTAIL